MCNDISELCVATPQNVKIHVMPFLARSCAGPECSANCAWRLTLTLLTVYVLFAHTHCAAAEPCFWGTANEDTGVMAAQSYKVRSVTNETRITAERRLCSNKGLNYVFSPYPRIPVYLMHIPCVCDNRFWLCVKGIFARKNDKSQKK